MCILGRCSEVTVKDRVTAKYSIKIPFETEPSFSFEPPYPSSITINDKFIRLFEIALVKFLRAFLMVPCTSSEWPSRLKSEKWYWWDEAEGVRARKIYRIAITFPSLSRPRITVRTIVVQKNVGDSHTSLMRADFDLIWSFNMAQNSRCSIGAVTLACMAKNNVSRISVEFWVACNTKTRKIQRFSLEPSYWLEHQSGSKRQWKMNHRGMNASKQEVYANLPQSSRRRDTDAVMNIRQQNTEPNKPPRKSWNYSKW